MGQKSVFVKRFAATWLELSSAAEDSNTSVGEGGGGDGGDAPQVTR